MGDWYIQVDDNGTIRKYKLMGITSLSPRQKKPMTSISIPGEPPSANILLALQGMERTYDISFYIKDRDEDMSMGTAPTDVFPNGVKTKLEQEVWLTDYIHASKLSSTWKLFGDYFPSGGIDCILEEIMIQVKEDDPLKDDCSLKLTVGQVVA